MICYFCGDATEDVVETDLPLGRIKRLEYKKIGICKKKQCRRMLERRLKGGDTGVQVGNQDVENSQVVAGESRGEVFSPSPAFPHGVSARRAPVI
jgi:hypothetical protein